MGYKGRDVEVHELENGLCLVGACDSCGSVGSKELDIVQVPARLVGQLTARVVLMEIIATGALPRMMTVTITSEPEPTGREILEGVRRELASAGIPDLSLAISTEKNFISRQTGLGIGVTGTCRKGDLRIAGSTPGDPVFCLGLPRVGEEVARARESDIVTPGHIRTLLALPDVHDVVPVGSRGILAEARDLARHAGTRFVPEPALEPAPDSAPPPAPVPDIRKPAGPSTCAIFTTTTSFDRNTAEQALAGLPLSCVGCLVPPEPDIRDNI